LEVPHGRPGAVVGDILNYGEAWSAVGAVGKGVTVAPIMRREDFPQAILTGSDIWRNKLIFAFFGDAVADFKSFVLFTGGWKVMYRYVFNTGSGWGLL
jgi:hypothetical protein